MGSIPTRGETRKREKFFFFFSLHLIEVEVVNFLVNVIFVVVAFALEPIDELLKVFDQLVLIRQTAFVIDQILFLSLIHISEPTRRS